MNMESKAADTGPQLPHTPMDVTSALQAARRDVRVAEGETLEVGPNSHERACFHLIHVQSYQDLQMLDLVPRELDKDRVTGAIASDDADAYHLARDRGGKEVGGCGCGHDEATAASPLRAAYDAARPRHHPNLALLLGEHYDQRMAWDDILPRIVRNWHERLVSTTPLFLGLLALDDIEIADHATLKVAKNVQVLNARDISIGREGRLDLRGGGAKVRCHSVSGPSRFGTRYVNEIASNLAVNRLETQS